MKLNIKKIVSILLIILLIVSIFTVIYINYNRKLNNNFNYDTNGDVKNELDEIIKTEENEKITEIENDNNTKTEEIKKEDFVTSKTDVINKVEDDFSKNNIIKNDTSIKETTSNDKTENSSDEVTNETDNKDESGKSNLDNIIEKPNKEDKVTENSLSLENNKLRQNIKSKYGVNVGYKDEIDGVYVSDYAKPTKQYDDEKINKLLNTIDSALKKYPSNFFFEISKKWKPVTIFLVEKINGYASGLTDNRNNNTVVILINTEGLLFESTLHHEIMHYIDCYLATIIGANTIEESMKPYNPPEFVYGLQTNEYVYYYSTPSYFLSAYSKSNYKEDRAVLFADMMFRSLKKDYYTLGNPINEKAKLISNQLEKYFDCVSNSVKEHWERFIE